MIYVLFVFEQNSPGNLSMSNQPGTPREDGEMGGNFLNPFQSESVSENLFLNIWDYWRCLLLRVPCNTLP